MKFNHRKLITLLVGFMVGYTMTLQLNQFVGSVDSTEKTQTKQGALLPDAPPEKNKIPQTNKPQINKVIPGPAPKHTVVSDRGSAASPQRSRQGCPDFDTDLNSLLYSEKAEQKPELNTLEMSSMLVLWSMRDPVAAADWFHDHLDDIAALGEEHQQHLIAAFHNCFKGDAGAAGLAIAKMPAGELRQIMADDYIFAAAKDDMDLAQKFYDTLEDEGLGNLAAAALVEKMSSRDPLSALDFLWDNPSITPEEVSASDLSTDDPFRASDDTAANAEASSAPGVTAVSLQTIGQDLAKTGDMDQIISETTGLQDYPPHVRSNIVEGIIGGLMIYEPASAPRFIEHMPSGEMRDATVVSYLAYAAETNDREHLIEMAESIEDAGQREAAITEIESYQRQNIMEREL